jgi:hypothetical protein
VGGMVKDGNFKVEKFNSQNYQLWKMQMEDYLYQKDIFLPFGRKENQSKIMKDKEWEVLDRKELGTENDTTVPGSVSGFQYFKINDNDGFDEGIG